MIKLCFANLSRLYKVRKKNLENLEKNVNRQSHLIILLHGIAKNSNSLDGLSRFLLKEGFSVMNISYPSTKHSIEGLSAIIHEQIKLETPKYKSVSFIGFSMGGLVIRAYLNRYKIPNLGKVVMMGTPNKGSEIADFFRANKLYKRLFGPAGSQLMTDQQDMHHLFGSIYYECGIIAGDLPLDFYYPLFKGEANDGKVSVNSTKIENITDHIVVRTTHWNMTYNRKVWKLVLNFINHSKFNIGV